MSVLIILFLGFMLISAVNADELVNDTVLSASDEIIVENSNEDLPDETNSFKDLSQVVSETPENDTLTLEKDYKWVNDSSNKGVLISKSITIDGAGHTLDGNHSSRIFNITADNVVLKNINFRNGNALGRYFTNTNVGGGAIYWSGNNGLLLNCTFINNHGSGLEEDPFDKEETYVTEDGMIVYIYKSRPMGAKINEGGAIVWTGSDGVVKNCLFKDNGVGYPNPGGAICWRGDFGKVIESEFYHNNAWLGSAICWFGKCGWINSSSFLNDGIGTSLYWVDKKVNATNAIVFDLYRTPIANIYMCDFDLEDILAQSIGTGLKSVNITPVNNWLTLSFIFDNVVDYAQENITIPFDLKFLPDSSGVVKKYIEDNNISIDLYLGNGVVINFVNGHGEYLIKNKLYVKELDYGTSCNIVSLAKITQNKDLNIYYQSGSEFKVRVYGADGKIVSGKKVMFAINNLVHYVKTDKNGYASIKINKKPGKYTVIVQYGSVTVKNKITVKTTLITKNLSKKYKKSAKFAVKVLNPKGKAFANKIVKVKFKGKTYKIKTNKKGIAVFNVSKKLKVGEYTIKTTYNGLTNSNKIIVKK